MNDRYVFFIYVRVYLGAQLFSSNILNYLPDVFRTIIFVTIINIFLINYNNLIMMFNLKTEIKYYGIENN